jgi:hypothetical protein
LVEHFGFLAQMARSGMHERINTLPPDGWNFWNFLEVR